MVDHGYGEQNILFRDIPIRIAVKFGVYFYPDGKVKIFNPFDTQIFLKEIHPETFRYSGSLYLYPNGSVKFFKNVPNNNSFPVLGGKLQLRNSISTLHELHENGQLKTARDIKSGAISTPKMNIVFNKTNYVGSYDKAEFSENGSLLYAHGDEFEGSVFFKNAEILVDRELRIYPNGNLRSLKFTRDNLVSISVFGNMLNHIASIHFDEDERVIKTSHQNPFGNVEQTLLPGTYNWHGKIFRLCNEVTIKPYFTYYPNGMLKVANIIIETGELGRCVRKNFSPNGGMLN